MQPPSQTEEGKTWKSVRFSADSYLLGSYRIATAPEPNSRRLTSFKSTYFDSPANNVGPWPPAWAAPRTRIHRCPENGCFKNIEDLCEAQCSWRLRAVLSLSSRHCGRYLPTQPLEIPSSVLEESSTEPRLHQRTTRNPGAYLCGCSYPAAPREETSWVRTRPSPPQLSGLRSVYP